MDRLAEFAVNHWVLVTAFFMVLGLLLANLMSAAGGIEPQAAVMLVNRSDAVVIDVRNEADFNAAHIIDAIHIPLSDISGAEARLKKHLGKPVIVYGGSGAQSQQGARLISQQGFEACHSLKGGFSSWQTENLPTSSS